LPKDSKQEAAAQNQTINQMYKKYTTKRGKGDSCAIKILRIMRLTTAILIAAFMQVSAAGLAQKITLSRANAPLKTILKELRRQSGFNFLYTDNVLKEANPVNIRFKETDIQEALKEIFEDQPLTYSINENTITIREKEHFQTKGKEAIKKETIKGKVLDEQGKPIPGVNIMAMGASKGTATDLNGNFSLELGAGDKELIISAIGYISQTISVGKERSFQIVLKESNAKLDEIVVVGYGTQKKVSLTGAVASVSGVELNKRVVTNPAALLQGKLPGLQVVQNSGEPGNEGISLQVRGQGTYSAAGNAPLVIVNGLPGSLANLDPNNIESVSVLKDAASAAIYGSRAANGVILVTTKNGKEGKMSLEYGYNIGITNPTKLLNLVTNSAEYMELFNRANANSGRPPQYSQDLIDAYKNATDKVQYPNTDWQDIMFNTAYVQNHYLNMTGGNNGTNYSVALGIVDQPGVQRGISFKKYNLQFDLSSKLSDAIKFGANTTINYGNRTFPQYGSGDQYLSTLAQAPTYGPLLPDGSGRYTYKAYAFEPNNKNPVAQADLAGAKEQSYYLQSNVFVNVRLLEGLQWETRLGTNVTFAKTKTFTPTILTYFWHSGDLNPGSNVSNSLNVNDNFSAYPMGYSQLTYSKKIQDHNIGVLIGTQREYFKNEALTGVRSSFPNNDVREINAGATNGQSATGSAYEWSISSYYGRLNYDYKEKYLLEANARYDGSSRFADGRRWGLFPSVSLGWRFTKEVFLDNKLSWLNDGKLRASWGRLGNQNIGGDYPYPYQSILGPIGYPFDGNTVVQGLRLGGLVDKTITWETTQIKNLGLDLTLLNRKLNVSMDYFQKHTFDILREAQIPFYVGLKAPIINSGELKNKGFEIQANYSSNIGEFTYSIGGNIQAYKNELVGFGKKELGDNTIRENGQPYNTFYLYDWIGIFQSDAEIASSPVQPVAPHPGDLKFRDVNHDNKIDENDRTYFGGAFPTYTYGFNFNAGWKNFDFTAFFYGSEGQKVYATGWGIEPFSQGSVPTVDWRNSWTPNNPTQTMPRIYVSGSYPAVSSYASTYFLQNASFLRLKNLQLGYNFPTTIAKKLLMQGLRLYFSGDNLMTFSKYPGLDPERTSNSGRYLAYPQNRVYSFGIRAKF